jgi:hypothetical protein
VKVEGSFMLNVLYEDVFVGVVVVRVAVVWLVIEDVLVKETSFIVQVWVVFVDAPCLILLWSYSFSRAEPTGIPESKLTLI